VKKIVVSIMIILMVVNGSILFANGQKDEGEESASEETVTIKWYIDGTPQRDTDKVLVEANKILNKEINANIDLIYIDWGNYNDAMQLKVASGEEFDLAFTSSWVFDFQQNAAKGAFLPLDDLLKEYGQNILEQVQPPSLWDAVRVDGKIYAVLHYGSYVNGKGIGFNKAILEETGFDISNIQKLADLEPYLALIKKTMPELTPYSISAGDGSTQPAEIDQFDPESVGTYEILSRNTGLIYDYKTEKCSLIYDLPATVGLYNLYRDWYEKGYIRKDAASIQIDLEERKTQLYAAWQEHYCLGDEEIDNENASRVVGYPIQVIKLTDGVMTTSSIIPKLTAISSTSANPEKAMMLLNIINGSDNELFTILSMGIEGTHYNVVGNDPIDGKPILETISGNGYDAQLVWELGPDTTRPYSPGAGRKFLDTALALNANAIVSPIMGFSFNPSNVKTEMAACSAVTNKYNSTLNTGSDDVENVLAKLKDELQRAGIDSIIAEADKQISDWKAANKK